MPAPTRSSFLYTVAVSRCLYPASSAHSAAWVACRPLICQVPKPSSGISPPPVSFADAFGTAGVAAIGLFPPRHGVSPKPAPPWDTSANPVHRSSDQPLRPEQRAGRGEARGDERSTGEGRRELPG